MGREVSYGQEGRVKNTVAMTNTCFQDIESLIHLEVSTLLAMENVRKRFVKIVGSCLQFLGC
jgi:hypothetical protein